MFIVNDGKGNREAVPSEPPQKPKEEPEESEG
jgi:hypothetical protein